jgi:hypothetical protein
LYGERLSVKKLIKGTAIRMDGLLPSNLLNETSVRISERLSVKRLIKGGAIAKGNVSPKTL